MSDLAIRVDQVGKQYRIGEQERYKALRDVITDAAAAPFRAVRSALRNGNNGATRNSELETLNSNRFWALQDVSFEVKQGEVIGIIGRNGAGKSTLLKILSRITKPTKGHAEIHGRVGSLLEVGTGFHPELTGRENIYLNAAILGMRKAEVERKFDEIVAFAEVEKFIDTPVKRYSSGMYVRLAFAVAAHMETEVLLVDEVLAVGDAQFQKKCLGKMDEVAIAGRTVLFVSHNMGAVKSLCRHAIWLDSGSVKDQGTSQEIIPRYLSVSDTASGDGSISPQQHISGNRDVSIERVTITDLAGNGQDAFLIGEHFKVQLEYRSERRTKGTFWLLVSAVDGTVILSSFQKDISSPLQLDLYGRVSVVLDQLSFLPGVYIVSAGIFSGKTEMVDWVDSGAKFEILPHFKNGQAFDHRYGLVTQELTWGVETDGLAKIP